jgi:hypothetical protein
MGTTTVIPSTQQSGFNTRAQAVSLRQYRKPHTDTMATAVEQLQSQIDLLMNTLRALASAKTPIVLPYSLVDNTTIIYSPVFPDGYTALVILLQDSTGGRTVTWDSAFGTIPDLGPGDASTYSVLHFAGVGNRWYLVSMSLGQTL